jgi:hypothetical protein
MTEPHERAPAPPASPPVAAPASAPDPAPPPLPPLEPLLGLTEFIALTGLSVTLQAGLRRWMRVHQDDPDGHYPRLIWDAALRQMRQQPVEV